MKKQLLLVVLVSIAVLSFTSCTRPESSRGNSSTTSVSASSDANTNVTKNAETKSMTESSTQETSALTEKPVDSGITLESVKQAALDAGYAAEDIPEIDMQTVPRPVRGIFVNYADNTLQSQCPVYEFKSAADAKKFAKEVNDSGYSLCIVNEKLLALTGAKYGIILNDNEKTVLETFLNSRFLPYEEPALPPVNQDKDYAGAASRIQAIQQALDKLINKSVILYAKTLPADEAGMIQFLSFSMVGSADLSFTAPLNEDQANIDQVIQTWKLYGCTDVKMKHDKPHDYTMTGKRAGMDVPFSIHCLYSPEQDSVRLVDVNGKELLEFFEFVPLGNDHYAFQTLYERALVGYQDGEIKSLVYSLKPRTSELAYNPDDDKIYPAAADVNDAWVLAPGEKALEQLIVYDGETLQISALDFTGEKLAFEMKVK